MSLKKIVKSTLRFNIYNLIAKVLAIPKGIIVANLIIPEKYGIVNLIQLVMFYMTMFVPGFTTVAFRRIPGLYINGDFNQIQEIQDKTFTVDILFSFFFSFLVFFYLTLVELDFMIKTGLLFISFTFILSRFSFFYRNYAMAIQKFNVAADASLIESVFPIIFIVITIYWLDIYSIFISDLLTVIILFLYYKRKLKIVFKYKFDFNFIKSIFIESLVLQGQTITFWVSKMLDRTIASIFFDLHKFGLYSFASNYMNQALTFLNQLGQVMQPIFWANASKSENKEYSFDSAIKLSVFLAFVSSIIVPLIQGSMFFFTIVLMRNYTSALPVLNILTLYIPLLTIVTIPNLILNSTIVNKQNLSLVIWLISLIIGLILMILVLEIELSLENVAFAIVLNQLLNTLTNYLLIIKYLPPDHQKDKKFYFSIILPILCSFILTGLFNFFIKIENYTINIPFHLSRLDKFIYLINNSNKVALISISYILLTIFLFSLLYIFNYRKYFKINLVSFYPKKIND